MQLARQLAWRYFLSRRLSGAVNVLTIISVVGIGLGSAALIMVLSVFNGFQGLIQQVFSTFDPDIKVIAAEGRYLQASDSLLTYFRNVEGIEAATQTVQGKAVLRYYDFQAVVVVKGIQHDFTTVSNVQKALVNGSFSTTSQSGAAGFVLGTGVANRTVANLSDGFEAMELYTVAQGSNLLAAQEDALQRLVGYPTGIFGLQKEYDDNYVLTGFEQVQKLLGVEGRCSAYELRLRPGVDAELLARRLSKDLGPAYQILGAAQQHQSLYQILQAEKWVGYLVISLMLLVASCTVVGTLAMMVVEKRREIGILSAMGATEAFVRRIFLWEALFVGGLSGLIGVLVGGIFGWLQQTYGFIPLDGGENFLIKTYPLEMRATDFMAVVGTVLVLAWLAAYYPARTAARKLIVECLVP